MHNNNTNNKADNAVQCTAYEIGSELGDWEGAQH